MLVFIDESGDHNLDITKSDNTYNVFVLGAGLIDQIEYDTFDKKLRKIKTDLFGDDSFVIHTREMTRPSHAKDLRNKKLVDAKFRFSFSTQLNELIKKTNFKVISSVIRKDKVLGKVWDSAEDPYIFSFDFLLNRVLHYCQSDSCKIYPEKRTHNEDVKLELAFLRTKTTGTKLFRGAEISRMVEEFILKDKSDNTSGLQLADLIVTPIGRHILGKITKLIGNEIEYQNVKQKIDEEDLLIFP